MENATKALLIAASVLIVIVLIAVGVLLIGNASDTSDQAKQVGNSIGLAAGNASSDAIGGLKSTIISKKKFNSFINDFSDKYKTSNQLVDAILNDQNKKLSNQIQIVGYIYQDKYQTLDSEKTPELKELLKKFDSKNQQNNKEIFDYEINVWMPKLLQAGKLVKMNDALDFSEMDEKFKEVYKNKKRSGTNR